MNRKLTLHSKCWTRLLAMFVLALPAISAFAQEADSLATHDMRSVSVSAVQGTKSQFATTNTELIGHTQLIRAACCNLGESFTTNPSVDVSYSDAATGARQIKLLGLSGTYVQMLTENIPNLRGASIPYSLGYVPGPWMQSIQVSKGASSVKNGYESTTGQINIEFLKPQATDGVRGNAYFDSKLKLELNADASIHLNDKLSTSLLAHFENRQTAHDGNDDGFMDMPRIRQYNLMHRWAYVSSGFISQLSLRVLRDERESGQIMHHQTLDNPYLVNVQTNRYEGQWKNAIIVDHDRNASVALMLHASWHDADNQFGATTYNVLQKNGYAQLMYESDFGEHHNISVGASLNHDYYKERGDFAWAQGLIGFYPGMHPHNASYRSHETTPGLYAQYTYKLGDKLTVMPGIRWDHSSLYGGFVTPRLHVKYSPAEWFTLRASAGKGYRSPHALAENVSMLASGRSFTLNGETLYSTEFIHSLRQEEAWNYGLSTSFNIPICGKKLELNAEYYYTNFLHQMVMDVDGTSGVKSVNFEDLSGKSYSHTVQVDATYPFFEGFTAMAAFRYNDARTTYHGQLCRRPLTSRYKGLLTLSYKTDMDLWHFDLTGHLNGKGDLYDHTSYPTFFQLQAQITREFRHFSLYLGGENLTNYKMKQPIINAHDPWSNTFDATQIWGPTDGAMAYIGIRFTFEKM